MFDRRCLHRSHPVSTIAEFSGQIHQRGKRWLSASRFVRSRSKSHEIRRSASDWSRVNTLAFDRHGKRLASGGWDKYARIWDVDSGEQIATALSSFGGVADVTFSPDGERIAVSGGNAVHLCDVSTGDEIMTFYTNRGDACAAAYSEDGTRLAVSLSSPSPTNGIIWVLMHHERMKLRF